MWLFLVVLLLLLRLQWHELRVICRRPRRAVIVYVKDKGRGRSRIGHMIIGRQGGNGSSGVEGSRGHWQLRRRSSPGDSRPIRGSAGAAVLPRLVAGRRRPTTKETRSARDWSYTNRRGLFWRVQNPGTAGNDVGRERRCWLLVLLEVEGVSEEAGARQSAA